MTEVDNRGLSSDFWIPVVFLLVVLAPIAYFADKMHREGLARCEKAHGVWLDRELKCIEAKEIK